VLWCVEVKQERQLRPPPRLHHDQLLKLTAVLEHIQRQGVDDKALLGVLRDLDLVWVGVE
jgi:hypothetical protein